MQKFTSKFIEVTKKICMGLVVDKNAKNMLNINFKIKKFVNKWLT